LFDWLFGRKEESRAQPAAPTSRGSDEGGQPPPNADEQALQRYRYMLKTAPPETIEQAHEEAFAKLTPAQRAQALRELAAATPEEERAALAGGRDDPKAWRGWRRGPRCASRGRWSAPSAAWAGDSGWAVRSSPAWRPASSVA
jgi:hypothetical protein